MCGNYFWEVMKGQHSTCGSRQLPCQSQETHLPYHQKQPLTNGIEQPPTNRDTLSQRSRNDDIEALEEVTEENIRTILYDQRTKHAITVITQWLCDLDNDGLLPYRFPLDSVLDAMKLIMRNNIFEFGDCYFLQLIGTAMGTSAASQPTMYYKRFIDDIFGIWIGNTTNEWSSFCDDINNFGVLTWDIGDNKPSLSVDFLDLTIMIRGSKIETKTFQKKMNLYLYIPPSSAHPTGCIKGTVFGLIRRYHAQNTHRKDFIAIVRLFYLRLLNRGWERTYIRKLILEACSYVDRINHTPDTPGTQPTGDGLVQELYELHCADLLCNECGIERPTIAYSRPRNLGDYLTKTKLYQAPGESSSTIMGEYKDGLDPP
eukprot:scaffold94125_cov40-Cyclotella_meneghiniana.AAC.1